MRRKSRIPATCPRHLACSKARNCGSPRSGLEPFLPSSCLSFPILPLHSPLPPYSLPRRERDHASGSRGLQESSRKALGHKNHQRTEESLLEAGKGDAWAEKVARASSKAQGKDMFSTASKGDPHEKVEGEVNAGTCGVATGAMDRDHPLRRLINQVEDKPQTL